MNFVFCNWSFRVIRTHQHSNLCTFSTLRFKSWRVVFFGSDNYSLAGLVELHKQVECKSVCHLEVVTKNNETPVFEFASSKKIKTHLWPPTLSGTYDFGVIVSFGKFIPKKMLDQFSLGIINVHASLLPRWRGGMPIFHTLKNGDTTTGVTVIRINSDKFDTGEIVLQRSCAVGKNELMPSLYKRLSKLGSECLLEIINTMPECLENSVPQPDTNVSYAHIVQKEISVIKWNKMTATEVYNLFRAVHGLFKLKASLNGIVVELLCLSVNDLDESFPAEKMSESPPPGSVKYDKKNQCLLVQCKDKPIRLCTVSLGGKLYSACNFYRGYFKQKPEVALKFS